MGNIVPSMQEPGACSSGGEGGVAGHDPPVLPPFPSAPSLAGRGKGMGQRPGNMHGTPTFIGVP